MWPFSRRSRRGGDDRGADGPPTPQEAAQQPGRARSVFGASGPPSWSILPPMSPSLPPLALTLNRFFQGDLASFEDTRLTAVPLGHVVSPEGPAGHVEGLAVLRLVTAQRAGGGEGPELVYATPPAPPDEAWPVPLAGIATQTPQRRSIASSPPRSVMTSAAGNSLSGHARRANTPPRATPSRRPGGAAALPQSAPPGVRRRGLGAPLPSRPPTAQRLAAPGIDPQASAPGPPGATSSVPKPPRPGGIRRRGPTVRAQPRQPGAAATPTAAAPPAAPARADRQSPSRMAEASSPAEPPAVQRAEDRTVGPSAHSRPAPAGEPASPIGPSGGMASVNLPVAGEGPSSESHGGGAPTPPEKPPSMATPLAMPLATPPATGPTEPVARTTSWKPPAPSSVVAPPVARLTGDRTPKAVLTGPVTGDPSRAVSERRSRPGAPPTPPARAAQRSTRPGSAPTVKHTEPGVAAAYSPDTASPTDTARAAVKQEATSPSPSLAATPPAPPVSPKAPDPAAPPVAAPHSGDGHFPSPSAGPRRSTPTQRQAAPLVGGPAPPPTVQRGSPTPVTHDATAEPVPAPSGERHSVDSVPHGLPLALPPPTGVPPDSTSSALSEPPSSAVRGLGATTVARRSEPYGVPRPLVGSRPMVSPPGRPSAGPRVGAPQVAAAAGGRHAGPPADVAQRALVTPPVNPAGSRDLARLAPSRLEGGIFEPSGVLAAATVPPAVPAPSERPQLLLARPAAPAQSPPSPEVFSMTNPAPGRAGHQHPARPPRLPAVKPVPVASRSVSEPRSVTAPPSALKPTPSSMPSTLPAPRAVQRTVTSQRQPDSSTGAGVDLDALADQVFRRVRDQLRLDRERRGAIADRKG